MSSCAAVKHRVLLHRRPAVHQPEHRSDAPAAVSRVLVGNVVAAKKNRVIARTRSIGEPRQLRVHCAVVVQRKHGRRHGIGVHKERPIAGARSSLLADSVPLRDFYQLLWRQPPVHGVRLPVFPSVLWHAHTVGEGAGTGARQRTAHGRARGIKQKREKQKEKSGSHKRYKQRKKSGSHKRQTEQGTQGTRQSRQLRVNCVYAAVYEHSTRRASSCVHQGSSICLSACLSQPASLH